VFRRIAIDLYVAHLNVDEATAMGAAEQHGLAIAADDWQSLPDLWPYNARYGVPRPRDVSGESDDGKLCNRR
jgi:hypothetical protein